MKNLFIRLVALLGAAMAVHGVSAQEPQKHEAELRFDQAQREELADEPFPAVAVDSAVAGRPFAYKLNRKRTTEAAAYDAVTLWNVRKVKIRDRRMKLTDSTRREKVRLLKVAALASDASEFELQREQLITAIEHAARLERVSFESIF